jgi:hypothetical protein
MIFFCLGLPGRFAEWCDDVIARLAQSIGGSVAVQTWPSSDEMLGFQLLPSALDEVALKLIREAPTHLVMGARQPDERLRTVLAAGDARFIVALDDPRLAVSDMMAQTGAELGMITRAVANCCPLMMRFASLPGALRLDADRARTDIGGTVFTIARHLVPDMSDAQIVQIVDDIAATELTRAFALGEQSPTAISPQGYRVVDGALSGYAEQFRGAVDVGKIVWRRELFVLYAENFQRPNGVINVAGPPRALIYGPYIHLPPGRWMARIVLGVSPDAAGNSFLVDAFADNRQLSQTVLVPVKGGVYAADIEFSMDEASAWSLEIRVLVTNENARGELALGHVTLQPISTRQPDAITGSEDFETVLEF